MSEEIINQNETAVRRDWVKEAYETFIKDVEGDPTDPVAAIEAYFEKAANDELKAKAKAEGKTAASCWRFVQEVARLALHGRTGHIDPAAVYGVAMHYFQDVPTEWRPKDPAKPVKAVAAPEPLKTAEEPKTEEKTEPKPAKKSAKPRRKREKQGYFFDLMDGDQEKGAEE